MSAGTRRPVRLGRILLRLALAAALLATPQLVAAQPTEITAFVSVGVQSAVEELIEAFQKATGRRVAVTWATGALLNRRIEDGEAADVLIVPRAGIDALLKAGKLVAGWDVDLARSGVGVAVRRGAPKPDISTPEALRQALLASKAVAYPNPAVGGASGVHFASVLDRLGIAEAMKAKSRFPPPSASTAPLVVSGEADLAIQQISELMAADGIDLVGPLPGDLQLMTTFTAAIPTASVRPDAARTFVRFLASPSSARVMSTKGLIPASPPPSEVR